MAQQKVLGMEDIDNEDDEKLKIINKLNKSLYARLRPAGPIATTENASETERRTNVDMRNTPNCMSYDRFKRTTHPYNNGLLTHTHSKPNHMYTELANSATGDAMHMAMAMIDDDTELYAERCAEYSRRFASRQQQRPVAAKQLDTLAVSPALSTTRNTSSGTTLNNLSSFAGTTTDSLYNSNYLVTPICTEIDHAMMTSRSTSNYGNHDATAVMPHHIAQQQQQHGFPLPPPPPSFMATTTERGPYAYDNDDHDNSDVPLPSPPHTPTPAIHLQQPTTFTSSVDGKLFVMQHGGQQPPPTPPRNPNITLQQQSATKTMTVTTGGIHSSFKPIQNRAFLAKRLIATDARIPRTICNLSEQQYAVNRHNMIAERLQQLMVIDHQANGSHGGFQPDFDVSTAPSDPIERDLIAHYNKRIMFYRRDASLNNELNRHTNDDDDDDSDNQILPIITDRQYNGNNNNSPMHSGYLEVEKEDDSSCKLTFLEFLTRMLSIKGHLRGGI
jgi:hypothetical protein